MTGFVDRRRAPAVMLACGLGGLCLAAATAGLFGGLDPRLDILTHFTPFWLCGAGVAIGVGLLPATGRARRVLLAIGLLGLLAAAARLAPEMTRPIRPDVAGGAGARLRLVQFNAWRENADPVAAAAWIAGQNADLVTAEDVTPALRAAMTAQGYTAVPGMVSTAVFSRGLSPRPRFMVPFPDWALLPDMARGRFAIAGGPETFTVLAVHINRPNVESAWPEREALARLLDDQHHERLIVAGDFNLTPWSFGLARLDRRLGLERRDRAVATWPALGRIGGALRPLPPVLPLDHVYAGREWRTVSVRRGPRLGSDHFPLIVDLVLRP